MLFTVGILVALVVAAALLALVPDWRVALVSLWAVHALVALMLYRETTVAVAAAKLVTGTTVCLLLLPSIRALFGSTFRARRAAHRVIGQLAQRSTDEFFRAATVLVVAGAALALARTHPLVEGKDNFAWAWLVLLGLAMVLLARDIVRVGLGLLLLINGIDLLDTQVAQGQGLLSVAARSTLAVVLALVLGLCWTSLQAQGGRLREPWDRQRQV